MKTIGNGIGFLMIFVLIAAAVQALINAIVMVVVPLLITGGLVAIGLLAYRYYHKIESERRRDAFMTHLYGNLHNGGVHGNFMPPSQNFHIPQQPPIQQVPPQPQQEPPQDIPYMDFDEYLKYQQWQQQNGMK